MESALSLSARTTTLTLFTVSRAPNRHLFRRIPATHRTRPHTSISTKTLPFASFSRTNLSPVLQPQIRCRVDCFSSSASSFGTGGGISGGDVGGGDGGGGGNGGSDGGDLKSKLACGGGEELSSLSSDVIFLAVGGMTCGGCAASVKRILESQPQVSSASVDLTTETAIVWPVSEAKVIPNWQQQLGEALAKHLTTCGFKSNLRGGGAIEGDFSP